MPLSAVHDHRWDLSPGEARTLQTELAPEVVTIDRFGPIELVAGVDIGFEADGRVTRAAVAVLELASLKVVDQALARRPTRFPYVPGLLSFREIPAALDALRALATTPQLVLCDGQGLAHPRRFGLACHLGWLLDTPCIGVAKSRLIGEADAPELERGAWTPLRHGEDVIGVVLRTRRAVKPLYVSTGHRVSLVAAIRLTLASTGRFRLAEPIRQAHRLASRR